MPPATAPTTPATPVPAAPQSIAFSTNGILYTGLLKSDLHYNGPLSIAGGKLTFVDSATNTQIFSLSPADATSIAVTFDNVVIMTGGKRYAFSPDGTGSIKMAMVFGVAGLGYAKAKGNAAGLPQWLEALRAAGFPAKDSQKAAAKWGLLLGFGIVFVCLVIAVVATAMEG